MLPKVYYANPSFLDAKMLSINVPLVGIELCLPSKSLAQCHALTFMGFYAPILFSSRTSDQTTSSQKKKIRLSIHDFWANQAPDVSSRVRRLYYSRLHGSKHQPLTLPQTLVPCSTSSCFLKASWVRSSSIPVEKISLSD